MLEHIKFGLYLILHPFDGFWLLKNEKRGTVARASIIVLGVLFVNILSRQFTGFVFNYQYRERMDIFFEIRNVILPFALFCVGNWSVTTLSDGEGSFKDIYISTAYSLIPLIIISIPVMIASNFLTMDEGAYLLFFNSLAIGWMLFLIFIGNLTIHQFTVSKTVFNIIVTIISMACIIFILLIFLSLFQQILGFTVSVYNELSYRI